MATKFNLKKSHRESTTPHRSSPCQLQVQRLSLLFNKLSNAALHLFLPPLPRSPVDLECISGFLDRWLAPVHAVHTVHGAAVRGVLVTINIPIQTNSKTTIAKLAFDFHPVIFPGLDLGRPSPQARAGRGDCGWVWCLLEKVRQALKLLILRAAPP